jgi:hypothetical protein
VGAQLANTSRRRPSVASQSGHARATIPLGVKHAAVAPPLTTADRATLGLPRPPPGEGLDCLPFVGGPTKDQPLPTVVRCRERRQDVAPVEGLVYQHP